MSLSHIRIVLVEPAGALNVGSVARVLKNFGLQQWVLVNPQCDPVGEEARRMAVHASDLLEMATIVPTLPDALVGCARVIATTGIDRTTLNVPLEPPRQALPWLIEAQQPVALIFGREDRGLTRTELNYAHRLVQVPTSSDYASLNLAQAVAICCYELACQNQADHTSRLAAVPTVNLNSIDQRVTPQITPQITPQTHGSPQTSEASAPEALATIDVLDAYYHQLETLLLQIGYLYPHTAAQRMAKFRRLFGRAQLSPQEVAMLRGILSQMTWALQHRSTPSGADKRA